MIHELIERGVYLKDVAAELGVSPRTVRRALARQGPPSRRRKRKRFEKLIPYMARVDELLSQNVWNAEVIFVDIKARGYTGKTTVLRDYIKPKRVLRPSKATVRFETAPGEQLQQDWGEIETVIGGERVKAHFAVSVLGYSRRFHAFGAPCEDACHTYESLIRAFEWFEGVSKTVWVDNQKAAVLIHRPPQVRFNPRFLALARHYGFRAKACRPHRARTKGKVERLVGYVKQHFFVRYRAFESFAHLNQQLEAWLESVADARLQDTVKEVVAERFAREKPALKPLPAYRFDTAYHEPRQIGWDAYVDVAGNRYSVPSAYAGQGAIVHRELDGRFKILIQGRCVAEHTQRPKGSGWVTVADHHKRLWQALKVERRPLASYQEGA